MAAPLPADPSVLDRVVLHGLRRRTDLNGRLGTLVDFHPASGRWVVTLDAYPAKAVRVLPANLARAPVPDDAHTAPARTPPPAASRSAHDLPSADPLPQGHRAETAADAQPAPIRRGTRRRQRDWGSSDEAAEEERQRELELQHGL
jgi:hypothetical protein